MARVSLIRRKNLSTATGYDTLFLLIASSFILIINVAAQESGEEFEAVPEPPELPDPLVSGQPIEPEVTIIRTDEEVIEEYRMNGRLYQVKVTPVIGPVYYLVDRDGDGGGVVPLDERLCPSRRGVKRKMRGSFAQTLPEAPSRFTFHVSRIASHIDFEYHRTITTPPCNEDPPNHGCRTLERSRKDLGR